MNEKQLYKLDEYTGKLPNPRIFPIQGAGIVAITDYPNTFGDGFMMDLSVDEDERQRLEKLAVRTVTKQTCDDLVKQVKGATILLSEPRYIWEGFGYIAYVLFTPDDKPFGIQVKYYRYFRNRYLDCKFYTSKTFIAPKPVKVGDKIVGLWMPVGLPPIKEE